MNKQLMITLLACFVAHARATIVLDTKTIINKQEIKKTIELDESNQGTIDLDDDLHITVTATPQDSEVLINFKVIYENEVVAEPALVSNWNELSKLVCSAKQGEEVSEYYALEVTPHNK